MSRICLSLEFNQNCWTYQVTLWLNRVDPDQTAPEGTVWSGPTLFALKDCPSIKNKISHPSYLLALCHSFSDCEKTLLEIFESKDKTFQTLRRDSHRDLKIYKKHETWCFVFEHALSLPNFGRFFVTNKDKVCGRKLKTN